jgi:hypothetical protein
MNKKLSSQQKNFSVGSEVMFKHLSPESFLSQWFSKEGSNGGSGPLKKPFLKKTTK